MGVFGSGNENLIPHLARIERKLDTLLASLGLSSGGPPAAAGDPRMHEVHSLAAAGRKIEAIKLYREVTGLGLKEAKDAVDAM